MSRSRNFAKALQCVVLWLWQLPQNLVGAVTLCLYLPVRKIRDADEAGVYVSDRMLGGISLGGIILLSRAASKDERTVSHEYGHVLQSRMLGWLYLPVIGIPSIIWAALHRYIAPDKSYYWFYTERWADKLGNVRR